MKHLQLTAAIGAALLPLALQAQNAAKKPHIIFIMTDQQRGDAMGCMGNESIHTPAMNQLAQEGSLFTSAYTSTPSSTPARAGLLTGMSPWHHGMLGYGKVAEEYRYEMPRMLRDLGYYTFGIGKMHWNPQNALHGFHATLLDESGRAESKDFISDYRKWFQVFAPGLNPDETGIGWNAHAATTYKLDKSLHPTAWTGEMARELIRNYESEQPLFLKISFARPHSPYDPPQRYLDLYADADIPKPFVGDWCTEFANELDPSKASSDAPFANFGEEYAVNSRRHYYANITFIDDQIGAIIDVLKQKGMYDNALICFTADHGDMMGDHYHWRKTYPYEGSAKIPFIVKWPQSFGIKAGAKIEQPVELRDFLPTFIDIAGSTVPSDMDGASLRRLAEGNTSSWRKYIDLEHATCYRKENYWCALTDGKIKYVWNFNTGQEQLFDLVKDPGELHECSADKKYKKTLAEMRQAMIQHLSERGEPYIKDGNLVKLSSTILYSPAYPR
ncbi:arylsulfatase [Bacteroides sp. 519]|uniref:arylsulfatase n=1 Tax=Bacteroides sp. 519 TaxID=2302937 RepID=UPI0013D2C335|nr:arylsulfatase [Bacteroides sp. 519]NDV57154.1 arylsulfatase [Bacteroides sp. 519]